MNEYVVYQYNSHLRGRLLEYKCELNTYIVKSPKIWKNGCHTMILYNMKVEKFNDTVNQKFADLNKFIVGLMI